MIDLNVLCGMKGKTALITGASSGLGAGIARFFASAGVRVMGRDRRTGRRRMLPQMRRDGNGRLRGGCKSRV